TGVQTCALPILAAEALIAVLLASMSPRRASSPMRVVSQITSNQNTAHLTLGTILSARTRIQPSVRRRPSAPWPWAPTMKHSMMQVRCSSTEYVALSEKGLVTDLSYCEKD